jgi:hypothetical protein
MGFLISLNDRQEMLHPEIMMLHFASDLGCGGEDPVAAGVILGSVSSLTDNHSFVTATRSEAEPHWYYSRTSELPLS